MAVFFIFRKPKTAKGKRFLVNREPKVYENVKTAVFMKGTKTSAVVTEALADLYALKKPDAVMMCRKNALHPFEGGENETTLEFMSQRNDAAFLLLATHSKKRPDNLVFIRTFDYHVLDMIEVGITAFESIRSIGGPTCAVGLKPAFIFNGEMFEQNPDYNLVQTMLLDFFRGQVVDEVNLGGLESVISVTAVEGGRILFRVYRIMLKKSGSRTPLIELKLMGPSIDFSIGRVRAAAPELVHQALKKPKEVAPKKKKNITTTELGETMGRVHVGNQKIEEIQTRKLKALKKSRKEVEEEEEEQRAPLAKKVRVKKSRKEETDE